MEPLPEIQVPPLTDLISSLEQAALMAKQFPSTTTHDPTQIFQICSSLQNAHHQISTFLSRFQSSQQPQAAENSFSSAVGEGEPMQVGDDDEALEEENSKLIIDKVEERMKNCVLQNKRRKRPLSPSSFAMDQRVLSDDRLLVQGFSEFDPQGTRLRALDLIYQFHG